jgi:chaperone BCS1
VSITDFVVDQIQTNQFASASLIAAPVAAMSYSIRNLPALLYRKTKRQLFMDIRFNSDQLVFHEVMSYLTSDVIYERFSKDYVFLSDDSKGYYNIDPSGNAELQTNIKSRRIEIGYGVHFGVFKGHFVIITRRLEESTQTDNFKESCVCSFLFGTRKLLDEFQNTVTQKSDVLREQSKGVQVRVNGSAAWRTLTKLPPRPLSSIFLPDNIPQRVLDHIEAFDARSTWNIDKGLPNRTGVLFHGVPGTAKSSLIHAIASATKRDIYYLNLNSTDDLNLSSLMSNNIEWKKAILAVEDIDASKAPVEQRNDDDDKDKSNKRLSLATLLNTLDGILSPDGLIVIATTNHIEHLDPALLRPGRFDLKIEIGCIGLEEFKKMASFFECDPSEYALDYFHPMSGAQMRSLLLEGGVEAVQNYQKSIAA